MFASRRKKTGRVTMTSHEEAKENLESEEKENIVEFVPLESAEKLSLEEELKTAKEHNLRQLAEMENLRKRLHKEKLEMNRFAVENVLLEILAPLDNFETALGFT